MIINIYTCPQKEDDVDVCDEDEDVCDEDEDEDGDEDADGLRRRKKDLRRTRIQAASADQ